MGVIGFDHLVLVCADVETTLRWYLDVIGLSPVRVDEWRAGETFFPSARIDEGTIIDFVPAAAGEGHGRNVDHLCMVVDDLTVPDGFVVEDGPGPRYGARGMGTSIYGRDPDGTLVELRTYP